MILFFNLVPRWEYSGRNLILNGSFTEDYKHWNLHGQGTNYLQKDSLGTRLHLNGQPQTFQGVSQEIPLLNDPTLYHFSFTAQTTLKNKASYPLWQSPAVFMVYKDSLGNLIWKDLCILKLFSKTQGLHKIERIIKFPETIRSAFLVVQVDGAQVDSVLGDFELKAVRPDPFFKSIEGILALLCIIIFFYGAWLLPSDKHKGILVVFLAGLLVAMVFPNSKLVYLMRFFWDWNTAVPIIKESLPNPWCLLNNPHISPDTSLSLMKSLSHFFSFTLICIFTFCVYSRFLPARILAGLILYAFFAEQIQNFTISRYAEWNGLKMNFLGLLSGFFIAMILSVFQRTPKLPDGNVCKGIVFYSKTILFYFVFIVSIILESFILHLFPLIFREKDAWYFCVKWGNFINKMLQLIGDVKIVVKGESPKELSPALLIVNHTGPWETVGFMPFYPVKLVYVIKKELLSWKYSFFALGLKAMNPIAISREANSGDFNRIKDFALRHFNEQKHVLIFPKGTRSALKDSIDIPPVGILLAKKLKCRVLPVFIDTEAWARGKYIKDWGMIYPQTITISFGKPISVEEITSLSIRENHEKVVDFYKKELKSLSKS